MKLCINCYRELSYDAGDYYCGNSHCYRYGLVSRQTMSMNKDPELFQPHLLINFNEILPKTNEQTTP